MQGGYTGVTDGSVYGVSAVHRGTCRERPLTAPFRIQTFCTSERENQAVEDWKSKGSLRSLITKLMHCCSFNWGDAVGHNY